MVSHDKCDCWQCVEDEIKEASLSMQHITCTCASRYVQYAEHENDCELWLLDEFFTGWLAWDSFNECLVQTDQHPNIKDNSVYYRGQEDDGEVEWIEEYYEQKELSQADEDVMLTTDKFIERMLNKNPEDEDIEWVKDSYGVWRPADKPYSTTTRTTTSPHLPGQYSQATSADDDYDCTWNGDWAQYMSDRHCETQVHMPLGDLTIQVTSHGENYKRNGKDPDFGLYAYSGWDVDWLHMMIPWQDFGLPNIEFNYADYAIETAYQWAKQGKVVEVGCMGSHGRTGVILACMAILDDPELDARGAVNFVRIAFCNHAVETGVQEWYVARFHAKRHGLEIPPRPHINPPAVAKVVSVDPKVSTNDACSSTPSDPNKPGRRRRSRRSKRGGKYNRAKVGVR